MNQQSFQIPAWTTTITLVERIASLHTDRAKTLNVQVNADLLSDNAALAVTAAIWKESYFAQRLAIDEITEDQLLYLLGEPIKAVQ